MNFVNKLVSYILNKVKHTIALSWDGIFSWEGGTSKAHKSEHLYHKNEEIVYCKLHHTACLVIKNAFTTS